MEKSLRVHHFEPFCHSNGPGKRAVLWLQGCTLNCPGCFNPQTHSPTGGRAISIKNLLSRILQISDSVEGITISGGEPLQQLRSLLLLLSEIRKQTNLSILLFSGFTFEEICSFPTANQLLTTVDVLISGRYDQTADIQNLWVGSSNKTIHILSSRYSMKDLSNIPVAEMIITPNGEILSSGIMPIILD